MLEKQLSKVFKKNSDGMYEIFDRFSFDNMFRLLLKHDFDHDEALNFILCNCTLSALVFQERIYNKYYLKLSTQTKTSDDLVDLMYQTLLERVINQHKEIERLKRT